ncbi:MAG: MFS transporter, partial [Thermoanaerobaculales bacterium]|nr:MFS transporter [Thermoanaerobaculales bacterium]
MATASRYRPTTAPDAARVARARLGVLVLFLAMGMMFATLFSRLPTLRDDLGVDKGRLATLLIFGAGGAFVALLVTGWAAARFGTRALLFWSTFGYTAAFVVIGYSSLIGAPALFAAGQFFAAFSFAFTNVSMNAEAAAIERHMRRKVMPQFHAAFSVGMAIGLAIGALFSHFGVEVLWHFMIVCLVLMVVRLAVIPMAVVDGRPVEPEGAGLGGPFATARAEFRDRRVLMIGAIVFAAAMTEGAAAQWVAISGRDDFGKPESIGVAMYWIFIVAMVTVRFLGTNLLERFGRVAMLRASAVSTIVGILIFAFTPTFWLVPVALVFWGVGAALGVPIGFSAAADEPKRAAARVAAVSSFATIAGVTIPPVIGYLADATSTRHALLVVILGCLVTLTLARAVRRDEKLFLRLRRRFGG